MTAAAATSAAASASAPAAAAMVVLLVSLRCLVERWRRRIWARGGGMAKEEEEEGLLLLLVWEIEVELDLEKLVFGRSGSLEIFLVVVVFLSSSCWRRRFLWRVCVSWKFSFFFVFFFGRSG